MTTPESPERDGGPASGGGPRGKAAELLAAVRAVESGERPAASFFNEPHPTTEPQQTAGTPPAAAEPPGTVQEPAADAIGRLLAEGRAPATLAGAVARQLGTGAAALLREDPWRLLAVPGVRPEQADGFARTLLGQQCSPDDPRRSRALTRWLLDRAARSGHTVLDAPALHRKLADQQVPDPDEALRAAVDDGTVLAFRATAAPTPEEPSTAQEPPEGAAEPAHLLFGLEQHAIAEESLADGLLRLRDTFAASTAPDPAGHLDPAGYLDPNASAGAEPPGAPEPAPGAPIRDGRAPADWEAAAATAPSRCAAELIAAAAGTGLLVHTGGEAARIEPAALVDAARSLGLRAVAATHTEDGRQRLAALIPAPPASDADPAEPDRKPDPAAVTVAGLLSGREGPGRDEDGTLALDLLAVLDAGQLDVETGAALVESLRDGARLVLSGDPQLLGPAGPGRVLTDLLAARCCPQIVSRTPDPGPLGELLSGIGIGELNRVAAPEKEIVIVPVQDAGEAVHRAGQLVADSVPRAIGVPAEQTQVITARHGGAAGTETLNSALKERFNPGPGRFGGFDPGDRVAHSPVPGRTRMGTVRSGDDAGLRLDLAGGSVVVPPDQVAGTVRHGWAVTAHQAVGIRWPAVVVVLPGDATHLLNRSWVYSAFSRGERHLSVVHGAGRALAEAVAAGPETVPATRLRDLLRTAPGAA